MGLLADRPLRLLQPTRIPEIDWHNPITRGLQFCFDGQSQIDATRGKRLSAAGLLKPTKSGRGLGYEVLGSSTVAQMSGRTFTQGTGMSMFVMVDHGTASGYQSLLGRGTYSGATDTSFASDAGALELAHQEGSSSLGSIQSAGLHSYGVTCAGTSCTGYVDGKAANTITYTFYMDYAANTWLVGASSTDYLSENFLGTYLIAAAWNRALSASEMRSLHENPWQVFEAPLRIIPVQAASATPQYLAPVSDVAAGSWLPSTGTDLYAMLDESSYSDTDYIYATSATTATMAIASGGDPAVSTGHTLRYRLLSGSGKIAVTLKQSSTTIASWGPHTLTGAAQDFAQTLTAGEADSITDYSALRVEFTSSLT